MRIWLALLVSLATACAGAGAYEPCGADGDCASGRCGRFYPGNASFVCLAACDADADCPAGLVCGALGADDHVCVPACDPAGYDYVGFACVDDTPVACEVAGAAADCRTCGCADDQRCDASWRDVGVPTCQPRRAVGEPCLDNAECASANCSVTGRTDRAQAGVCQVPGGAPCTEANCRACGRTPEGSTCARTCLRQDECPQGEVCMIDRVSEYGTCLRDCTETACPYAWTCLPAIPLSLAVCLPPDTCDVEAPSCATCAPVPGADYGLCTERCNPDIPQCQPGWTCGALNGGFACLPPPR